MDVFSWLDVGCWLWLSFVDVVADDNAQIPDVPQDAVNRVSVGHDALLSTELS